MGVGWAFPLLMVLFTVIRHLPTGRRSEGHIGFSNFIGNLSGSQEKGRAAIYRAFVMRLF